MPHTLPDRARVLVVRLSALGDVLFALETVAALAAARPDVRIDFLVEDRFASLLHGHPQIERLVLQPRRRRFAWWSYLRDLRRVRYDAVLDLHGILKSALPVRLARAALRIGYAPPGAREGAHRAYDVAVPLPDPLPHRADRGYALLGALGIDAPVTAPVLPPPAEPVTFWPTDTHRRRVIIHPGASAFAAFKRWPAEKHAALARHLVAQDVDVAVSFGPGERELAQSVVAAAPGARALDGTELGLLGLAAVMREAHAVVAADTGPLHIAAAAGAPVVALFGPKDPALYGPRGAPGAHETLWHDVPCRPCRRRTCASPQCILGLDVERVAAAVDAKLQTATLGPGS